MDKYKSFFGTLLIMVILLNFISVCAANEDSKKHKNTYGGHSCSTRTSKSRGTPKPTDSKLGTSSAIPSEGISLATHSEGGIPSASPPASPSEGAPPASPPASPSEGTPPAPPPASPSEGAPPAPPPASPSAGTPPASSPSASPSAIPTPGGESNATVLAYALFSNTPSTTSAGRPQVNGLISLFQPPDGNTVVTGQIGAILNRTDGNYKFTIKDGRGVVSYDITGRIIPIFIGQASLFSFTWDAIKLSGPETAIGKHFVVEESGGTLVDGLIVNEFNLT